MDKLYPLSEYFTLTCLFLLWLISLISYGRLIAHAFVKKETELWHNAFFGTAFYTLVCFFLGSLNLLSPVPFWVILVLGLILAGASPICRNHLIPRLPKLSKITYKLTGSHLLVILFFIVILIRSYNFNLLQDVYYYHLYGPKLWYESGGFTFNPAQPLVAQAGIWDYLYLWPFGLLFSTGENLLISVQLFSQLIHGVLACGLSFLILNELLRNIKTSLRLPLILACLTPQSLFWTAWHAKNDYGSLLFLVGVLLLVRNRILTKKAGTWETFTIGVFLGLGGTIKFHNLVLIFFMVMSAPYFFRKDLNIKTFITINLGFAVGLMPILLRNYGWTGNPFIPALEGLEKSVLSPTIALYYHTRSSGQNLSFFLLIKIFSDCLKNFYLLPLIVGLFLSKRTFLRWCGVSFLLTMTFFILKLQESIIIDIHQIRLISQFFIIFSALGGVGFYQWVQKKSSQKRKIILAVFTTVILGVFALNFKEPLLRLKDLPQDFNPTLKMKNRLTTHACREWIKNQGNLKENDRVLSMADDHMYFYPSKNWSVAYRDPNFDGDLRLMRSNKTSALVLKEKKVRYIYGYKKPINSAFGYAAHFLELKEELTPVFSAKNCLVLEVEAKSRP